MPASLEAAALAFFPICFLATSFGWEVVSAGAVTAAGVKAAPVVLGVTAAGVCANETAATLESRAVAIKVLKLNMINTHS